MQPSTHVTTRPLSRPVAEFIDEWTSALQVRNMVADEINASKKHYKDIAAACGVTPRTVSRLAAKITFEPRLSTVVSILIYFGYRIRAEKVT